MIDLVVDRLRVRREQLGLSRSDLAKMAGSTELDILNIEEGDISPTLGMLTKLCEIMKMSIDLVELVPASVEKDVIFLRSLDPGELQREIMNRRWYVQPNDLIGGFSLMPMNAPPSTGCFEIAESMFEWVLEYIAEVHNEEVDHSGDGRDPSCVTRWPDCFSGGFHPDCCRFPKSCSC